MDKPLWEILIPIYKPGKTKKKFSKRYNNAWVDKVQKISGGLTIFLPVKGLWSSPDGSVFVEPMVPVRISCNEDEINSIADLTASHYCQMAVMFYKITDSVRIKSYA